MLSYEGRRYEFVTICLLQRATTISFKVRQSEEPHKPETSSWGLRADLGSWGSSCLKKNISERNRCGDTDPETAG